MNETLTIDLSALLVCGKTCLLQKVLEPLSTNQESSHLILKVNTLSQRSNIDDRLINICIPMSIYPGQISQQS